MRYRSRSKSLQISLGLSILLHLCLFAYLHSLKSFKKIENAPISVDILSEPKEEQMAEKRPAAMKIGTAKIELGKSAASAAKEPYVPARSSDTHEPVEGPSPVATQGANMVPEPHPIEAPKPLSYPSIKDLTPSLDQLSKRGGQGQTGAQEEVNGGEGGKDEETVSLDSTDINYESYLHGVKFKIEGVWRYPDAAKKSGLQGRGLVSFVIERDGTVSRLELLNSSGYPILDEALMKGIRDAAPFNPMLGNMRVKKLKIVAGFEYNLVVQRMWGE